MQITKTYNSTINETAVMNLVISDGFLITPLWTFVGMFCNIEILMIPRETRIEAVVAE
jgi:hypothetical protein